MRSRWLLLPLTGGLSLVAIGVVAFGAVRLGALGTTPAMTSAAAAASVGRAAPDFVLQDAVTGKAVRLSDYRGKRVVVNFWATWCGPCRFELPALQQVYDDHGSADFVILAVNVGESNEVVATFRRDVRMTFPVLIDRKGATQLAYGEQVLPQTYFIDRRGIVRGRHIGGLSATELTRGLEFADGE